MLIARAYILQFYPQHEFDKTEVLLECEGRKFTCSSRKVTLPGWREIADDTVGSPDAEGSDGDDVAANLASLMAGEEGECVSGKLSRKETKPQPRYTIASLLKDLPSVAKYIKDEKLRKLLVEKDKGKEGEHGGIGTPATRDRIITDLLAQGYLEMQDKNVVSTKKARAHTTGFAAATRKAASKNTPTSRANRIIPANKPPTYAGAPFELRPRHT